MILCIHHGTHEIGGTCIEVSTKNTKIILDFGMPLTDQLGEDFNESLLKDKSISSLKSANILYGIKGLYRGEAPQVDGILISHSHRDHYGFLKYANPDIPVYISGGAKKLIDALNLFIHPEGRVNITNCQIVRHRQSFEIGDFKIIPYLVDHSGFDAMSYHIIDKTSGKSIFYSGDFRANGWKGDLLSRFIANPPQGVDYLLMEGTMIEREGGLYADEMAVVKKLKKILESSKNKITLTYASAQNIDRMVSFYKAVRKARSLLVIDPYTAYVLYSIQTPRKTIPQADWPDVRVLIADYFGDRDIYLNKIGNSNPAFLRMMRKAKIKTYELSKLDCKALVLMRNTMIPVISRIRGIAGSTLVYSQWDGYLKKKTKEAMKFARFVKKHDLAIEHVHTGGHATIDTLQQFAHAVVPAGKIIPIHTTSPHKFNTYFGDQVVFLKNGQALEI